MRINTDLVDFVKQLCNVETEKPFEYNNYPMRAVQTGGASCKGCDFYHESCISVNNALEKQYGHRCTDGWHIMFIDEKDKCEHYQN